MLLTDKFNDNHIHKPEAVDNHLIWSARNSSLFRTNKTHFEY